MELLRLARLLRERVARDQAVELGRAPNQDGDVEAEVALDPRLDRARVDVLGEHDVAALDMGGHVLGAEAGEEVAEVGHRDLVPRAEVDSAQQRHLLRPHATQAIGARS